MKLSELKFCSLSAGRPNPNMTDAQWQQYFSVMKLLIKPSKTRKMKCTAANMVINGCNMDGKIEYKGDTSYMNYCKYINSVLSTIRGEHSDVPRHDYCYFIYQIADLLKYEHDRLRTKYMSENECFEVWLDSE